MRPSPPTAETVDQPRAPTANERGELAELTLGLTARRPDAWEQLYRLTHLPVLRFLTARLSRAQQPGDPPVGPLAEDLLQAVYVAAIQSIQRFEAHKGTVDQWLLGVAQNKLQESKRQSARARKVKSLDAADLAAPAAAATTGEPTGEQASEPDFVAAALDQIEPRYAEVLRRKYILGESIEAIAFALGFKAATVGSWLHRGREQFRAAYLRLSHVADADAGGTAQA